MVALSQVEIRLVPNDYPSNMDARILALRHNSPRQVARLPAHEPLGAFGMTSRKSVLVRDNPLSLTVPHRLDA